MLLKNTPLLLLPSFTTEKTWQIKHNISKTYSVSSITGLSRGAEGVGKSPNLQAFESLWTSHHTKWERFWIFISGYIFFMVPTARQQLYLFAFFLLKKHFTEHRSGISPLFVLTKDNTKIRVHKQAISATSIHNKSWFLYPYKAKDLISMSASFFLLGVRGAHNHLCLIPDVKIERETRVSC